MSRIVQSLTAMKSATRRSVTLGAVAAGIAATTALGASPASAETWHYGSITWYNPSVGVGACGELVAAVSPQMYGSYPNPNNSPVCGKYVVVHAAGGKATWAKIVDTVARATLNPRQGAPSSCTGGGAEGSWRAVVIARVSWDRELPHGAGAGSSIYGRHEGMGPGVGRVARPRHRTCPATTPPRPQPVLRPARLAATGITAGEEPPWESRRPPPTHSPAVP